MPIAKTEDKATPDWQRRKELKFLLRNDNVDVLRQVLRGTCRPVVHNDQVSLVQSVYFDDGRFSCCQANLIGLANRQKLRFRWYDVPVPSGVFAEVKWRKNRVTGKHRQFITELPQVNWPDWLRYIEQHVKPEILSLMQVYREPVVLVQYKREHFQSPIQGIRLTLDYDLTFYSQLGTTRLDRSFAVKSQGTAVMEGKVPVGEESRLREFVYPYAARVGRCSKYVLGCRALGIVAS